MAAAAAAAAAAIHGGNPNAAALALAAATNHQNGGSAGGHGLPPPLIKGEKGGATGDVSPARSHHSRSSPMHERYKNYLKSFNTLNILFMTHVIAILMLHFDHYRSMKSPGGASSNASIHSASLISPKPGSHYGHNSTGGSIRDHSPQSRGGGGRSSSGASPPTMNSGHGVGSMPSSIALTNGGSGVPPSASPSPLSGVGSPLSRLQGMQPFDYRYAL